MAIFRIWAFLVNIRLHAKIRNLKPSLASILCTLGRKDKPWTGVAGAFVEHQHLVLTEVIIVFKLVSIFRILYVD
jgi:hypothetical protein